MDIDNENPAKGLKAAKAVCVKEGIATTDENVFIVATCKDKGVQFLKGEARVNIRKNEPAVAAPAGGAPAKASAYSVTVNGSKYDVSFDGDKADVNGKSYDFKVEAAGSASAASAQSASAPAKSSGPATVVAAAMPGLIVRIPVKVGDQVKEGDVLIVMEAMKMEMNIEATIDGTVSAIKIAQGDQVATGDEMVVLN
jgi:pyruvate carboxylase subunit B